MKKIMELVNGWLGARTITEDQMKQLIWAIANSSDLELELDRMVDAERTWMDGERKAVNDPLGSSNFQIHDELFKHLFEKGS